MVICVNAYSKEKDHSVLMSKRNPVVRYLIYLKIFRIDFFIIHLILDFRDAI